MSTSKIFFDFGDFTVDDFSPVVIKGFDKPFEEMTEHEIQTEIVRIRIDIKTEMHWQKQVNIEDTNRLIQMGELYKQIKQYYLTISEDYRKHVNSKNYRPALMIGARSW